MDKGRTSCAPDTHIKWAMAGLVGNQISAFVKNATGSYTDVFLILVALYAIAIIFVFAIRKEKK